MAGGSSDSEENYWPGFVDALTTMVMVLTFIMMILGVVVFSMSQNISKQLVQQIAEAANVQAKVGGTAEEVKEQIIAAIKASRAAKVDEDNAKKENSDTPRAQPLAMPAPSRPSQRTLLPSPPQPNDSEEAKKGGGSPNESPKTGEKSELTTAPPPSSIDQDPGKTEKDQRVESSRVMDEPAKSSGISVSDSGSILTVAFQKRVVQLDDVAAKDLERLLAASRAFRAANRLEVKGYADVSVLGVTEARRIAYYRTMLVRKQLVSVGFDAERITVRIEDAPAADGDLVRVFAR